MAEAIRLRYQVEGGDLIEAGGSSTRLRSALRDLGIPHDAIRRAGICMYEGEINMILHADGGEAIVTVEPGVITIVMRDQGPGIPDVHKAMQEGWSTVSEGLRDLGFGTGMGMSNIQRYADHMDLQTAPGQGTTITATINY